MVETVADCSLLVAKPLAGPGLAAQIVLLEAVVVAEIAVLVESAVMARVVVLAEEVDWQLLARLRWCADWTANEAVVEVSGRHLYLPWADGFV